MKKLHKKISAIALVGMIVSGGYLSSGLSSFANEVPNPQKQKSDFEKYSENLYSGSLPLDPEYAQQIPIKGLINDDNNEEVKKQIQKIIDVCKGKNLEPASQISSEFGEMDGKKRGLDGFFDGIEDIIKKFRGGEKLLGEPELFFDSVDDFEHYLNKNSDHIESGLYKLQIGNVQGIFRGRSGRVESK